MCIFSTVIIASFFRFSFITFSDNSSAQSCVQKLDNLEHKGRKLNCRIAVKDGGQPKQNTRNEGKRI